ncbi:hypothetical protein [Prosthecobacter vanneervenii]|uniref:Uncharacterized protein n=1 Tax=Prosthecobacter vanneervenii TaxID=48466 RepID=A0A7W7YGG8_9BACT|nr:hypothetical protein [Prosthecobacter vanneervenii]MBB5035713.1 hypothetical protein [Prosthecobacter vanneervenii]
MAFLFSSSHLPASRVRRPDLEADDDHDENPEAMPRSGGVRASSHLEGRVAEPETERSSGGSPAPRSGGAGIDWMARLKELAEQQQQCRRASQRRRPSATEAMLDMNNAATPSASTVNSSGTSAQTDENAPITVG